MFNNNAEQDDVIVLNEKEAIEGGRGFVGMLCHAIITNPEAFKRYFWKQPESMIITQRLLWNSIRTNDKELFKNASIIETEITSLEVPKRWRGLDTKHIKNAWTMVSFGTMAKYLDQEMLNFLTCADLADHKEDILLKVDPEDLFEYRIDEAPETMNYEKLAAFAVRHFLARNGMDELAIAFGQKMIDEAKPFRSNVCTGYFVMDRVDLPLLDKVLDYDQIRLVILPEGILASFVSHQGKMYTTTSWRGDGIQSGWITNERFAWAFHVFASCLWRDACVVARKALATKKKIVASKKERKRSRNKGGGKVILPRTIYEVQWASDEDREKIVRQAHQVRGHYRMLRDGWTRSEMAEEKAKEWGYPEPPDGFTFVEPHQRGSGEPLPKIRPVVAKGFQVANIVFQELGKRG